MKRPVKCQNSSKLETSQKTVGHYEIKDTEVTNYCQSVSP